MQLPLVLNYHAEMDIVMLTCLADEVDIFDDLIGAGKHVCWQRQWTLVGIELPSFAA